MSHDLEQYSTQDQYALERAGTMENLYGDVSDLYKEQTTPHIEEDTSAKALLETTIGSVIEMADEEGRSYVEQYLTEAVETVTQLFDRMSIEVTAPDIAYTPEAARQEERTPMARYDPSEDRIEIIRESTDEDRPIDVSLLGVLAHETWHKHMEERLRDRFGFIGRERPTIARGFGRTGDDGYHTEQVYGNTRSTNSNASAIGSSYHDLDGLEDIYSDVTDTVSMFDSLNDEELEVDETVPDVHLGGLDEALAHVITLTLDGGIEDPDLRDQYWDRVRDKYDQHAEQHDIYEDRTGSFGKEIALLGEYIASTVAGMNADRLEDDLDRLGTILAQDDRIIDQGLLSLDTKDDR